MRVKRDLQIANSTPLQVQDLKSGSADPEAVLGFMAYDDAHLSSVGHERDCRAADGRMTVQGPLDAGGAGSARHPSDAHLVMMDVDIAFSMIWTSSCNFTFLP
jgi:hypothetical protein